MASSSAWFPAMRRYLTAIAVGNLAWEAMQMPLYTLWRTGSTRDIAFAVVHCTGGDVLIAEAALVGSLLLLGGADWPRSHFLRVGGTAIVSGLAYTTYSEHLNTARSAWTYSELMPTLPWLGTGLAPLAQWVIVPALAFKAIGSPLWSRAGRHIAVPEFVPPTMRSTTSPPAADQPARPFRRAA